MQSDDRSRDDPLVGVARTDAETASRSTRALGRGLEDVSHLFLSGAGEASAQGGEDPRSTSGPALPRAGIAVLRPGAGLLKDQLRVTLVEYPDALESGLRVLGAAIPCNPYGEIDVLALDRSNQLVIVEVLTTLGDELFLPGISHVDWVARNRANVQRMYPTRAIDLARLPRLILVAPRFSPLTRSAIRQLTGPAIACFKYHSVTLSARTGILIEQLCEKDG
jgi:Holliday junction resolvase-like predicted endonuclease